MTNEEKQGLIRIFQEHVNKVSALPYENYILAEALYTRTMFLYKKYFEGSGFYVAADFFKINFKSVNVGTTARAAWDESHGRLLSFSQSMLDELQLPPGHTVEASAQTAWKQVKIVYSGIFLIISSFVLWSFNTWAKWGWLAQHPKRIALYLSFQLALLFVCALFFTNNKNGRFIEWLGIGVSIAFGIISLLG